MFWMSTCPSRTSTEASAFGIRSQTSVSPAAVEMVSLNLPNDGQLPQLPAGAYVETGVEIIGGAVRPTRHVLPEPAAELCRRACAVNSRLVDAALKHDQSALREVVELDPTIVDKQRGMGALWACMEAHADLVGRW